MMFGLDVDELEKIVDVIAANSHVERAMIYGSRALGTYKPWSDIDLSLYGMIPFSELMDINEQLEELPLPYKFDVLVYDNLSHQNLKDHIDRVGQEIYSRKES